MRRAKHSETSGDLPISIFFFIHKFTTTFLKIFPKHQMELVKDFARYNKKKVLSVSRGRLRHTRM